MKASLGPGSTDGVSTVSEWMGGWGGSVGIGGGWGRGGVGCSKGKRRGRKSWPGIRRKTAASESHGWRDLTGTDAWG